MDLCKRMVMMIDEMLLNAKTAAIFGHVRPDGDCVGSALALYNYISQRMSARMILL